MNASLKTISKQIPAKLSVGDTIAVISPAAPTESPDKNFKKGIQLLKKQGFQVKLMPNAKKKDAYLAGSDAQRASDLEAAFLDPEVKAILCARGGYGCSRLPPLLDLSIIKKNPKIFIGFSDVTVLHTAFYQETGLTGFYGPMLTSNLINPEPLSEKALFDIICAKNEIPYTLPNNAPYTCIQTGIAEAPMIGGNLTLLAALCGTPYQAQTQGHILFIEDWKEQYYSIDRQIQQMKMAGLFDDIKGLLFCDFSSMDDCEPNPPFDLSELFRRLTPELQGKNIPIGTGFSVGHGEETGTIPIGIHTRFDADAGTLTLLESPVKP